MCDKVLEETPAVAKAWFRRGEANFALNDWEVAKVGQKSPLVSKCFPFLISVILLRSFKRVCQPVFFCWVGGGGLILVILKGENALLLFSVPDPPDPHVFGLPGSGSISQRYGSGYGSFYRQAK